MLKWLRAPSGCGIGKVRRRHHCRVVLSWLAGMEVESTCAVAAVTIAQLTLRSWQRVQFGFAVLATFVWRSGKLISEQVRVAVRAPAAIVGRPQLHTAFCFLSQLAAAFCSRGAVCSLVGLFARRHARVTREVPVLTVVPGRTVLSLVPGTSSARTSKSTGIQVLEFVIVST